MNDHSFLAAVGMTAAAGAVLFASALAESRFPIEQHESVRRTLTLPSDGARALEVSNIEGAITVTGGSGTAIELVADRTYRGRTAADVDEAKRVARLDTSVTAAGVLVCGDASRRCRCDDRMARGNRRDDPDYRVETRFELRVPRAMAVTVCSVNGGEVSVSHTTGALDVSHVNGGIRVDDVDGASHLTTVNGSIHAAFARQPPGPSSFRSVNGDIVVSLPRDLAADLHLKTMNGGLFTDFETTPLPVAPAVPERRNGKFVYRSRGSVGVRVGRGGPELSFDTLNGDVRVLHP